LPRIQKFKRNRMVAILSVLFILMASVLALHLVKHKTIVISESDLALTIPTDWTHMRSGYQELVLTPDHDTLYIWSIRKETVRTDWKWDLPVMRTTPAPKLVSGSFQEVNKPIVILEDNTVIGGAPLQYVHLFKSSSLDIHQQDKITDMNAVVASARSVTIWNFWIGIVF